MPAVTAFLSLALLPLLVSTLAAAPPPPPAQSTASQPSPVQSAASQPSPAQSAASQPPPAQSTASQPSPVQSAASQPSPVQSAASQPSPVQSAAFLPPAQSAAFPPSPAQPSLAAPALGADASPSPAPPGVTPVGSWAWPLSPRPQVVHGFWIGPAPWSPGHRGVDLATAPGTIVHSPAAGIVRFAGSIAGRGVVTVDHGGGAVSSFEPVSTDLSAGDVVGRGQPVAVLAPPPTGVTHCSSQTCLHWGVRVNGEYVDPLSFLAHHGPAVLLPLGRP